MCTFYVFWNLEGQQSKCMSTVQLFCNDTQSEKDRVRGTEWERQSERVQGRETKGYDSLCELAENVNMRSLYNW